MIAWLKADPRRADVAAIGLLTLLWALFWWQIIVPGQMSFPEGDYTGQFLAFGDYQAQRLTAGELPLWNPYNNGGHPFLADTQAAVFYPPRLITIFVSEVLFEGWNYSAIQAETIAHFWIASMLMYAFLRVKTGSSTAGLAAGITVAYGGYLTGYPPLQLAVLEAGVWFPLALLGVYLASQGERWRVRPLALGAAALGLSLLAGHPQTSLFFSYGLVAYVLHRGVKGGLPLKWTVGALVLVVGVGYGIAAVQLLPGLEYTRLTVRSALGFAELAGGFPPDNLLTIIYPGSLTRWSPLYSGAAGLILAGAALGRRDGAGFWLSTALVGLGLSLGGAAVVYHIAYLLAPGFGWFRGQERAAFLIAQSVAILVGMGTACLLETSEVPKGIRQVLIGATVVGWAAALQLVIIDAASPAVDLAALKNAAFFFALVVTLTWGLFTLHGRLERPVWAALLVALIVFDLFSVTMGTNLEPIPMAERSLGNPLMAVTVEDDEPHRVDVDGTLFENYGTLFGFADIDGTSPLLLQARQDYGALPRAKRWQLLGVKYVFTLDRELEIPSEVEAVEPTGEQPLRAHQLSDTNPMVWMAYEVMDTPDDAQALGWLGDPSFDPRVRVVLPSQPSLDLPDELPQGWNAEIVAYEPEQIRVEVETPADGVLVLSEWDYPGWRVSINGEQGEIWRANAGLRAVPLEAGSHMLEFAYRPVSVIIGTVASGAALVSLAYTALWKGDRDE